MAALIKHFSPAAKPFHAYMRQGRDEAKARVAATSRALYIGNLAFVTTDAQIHALFGRCGTIERVIMGINKVTRLPCGFAFVIFMRRESAVEAARSLHGTVLDERIIKVEMDKGFHEGRQYGRGPSGGQVRDDLRTTFDEGRGGYGTGAATPFAGVGDSRRQSGGFRGGRDSYGGGGGGSGGRSSYGGGGRGGRRDSGFGAGTGQHGDQQQQQQAYGGAGSAEAALQQALAMAAAAVNPAAAAAIMGSLGMHAAAGAGGSLLGSFQAGPGAGGYGGYQDRRDSFGGGGGYRGGRGGGRGRGRDSYGAGGGGFRGGRSSYGGGRPSFGGDGAADASAAVLGSGGSSLGVGAKRRRRDEAAEGEAGAERDRYGDRPAGDRHEERGYRDRGPRAAERGDADWSAAGGSAGVSATAGSAAPGDRYERAGGRDSEGGGGRHSRYREEDEAYGAGRGRQGGAGGGGHERGYWEEGAGLGGGHGAGGGEGDLDEFGRVRRRDPLTGPSIAEGDSQRDRKRARYSEGPPPAGEGGGDQ